MRDQGRLVEWFDDKGYGFIQPHDQTKQKVFLHIKSFSKKGPRPIIGCALDYTITVDQQGRFCAQDVVYIRKIQKKVAVENQQPVSKMVYFIVIYAVCILVLSTMHQLPALYIPILILVNAVTYYFYKKDKTAAQQNGWRVEEKNLHLLAFLGGWPMAWYAQQHLRHKTKKDTFQKMYIVSIVLNIVLVAFLVSPFNTFLK